MFNLPAQSKRLAYPYFYLVKGFVRCIDLSMPLKIQMFDEFSGLHYCLFVKVLCCILLVLGSATSVGYHSPDLLSRRNLHSGKTLYLSGFSRAEKEGFEPSRRY